MTVSIMGHMSIDIKDKLVKEDHVVLLPTVLDEFFFDAMTKSFIVEHAKVSIISFFLL